MQRTAKPDARSPPARRGDGSAPGVAVRRIAVLWGDTLLDLVSVAPGATTTVRLRSGARLTATAGRRARDPIRVTVDGAAPQAIAPGAVVDLPSGHRIVAVADERLPAARGEAFVDGRLFHAVMVSAAVQVCLVSALVLTPKELGTGEPGGGVKVGDVARYLHVTGGTAPTKGAASFALPGRRPAEAEKVRISAAQGAPTAVARGARRGPTVQEAIDAMIRALNRGSDGVELREALGDVALSTVRAPQVGAGFGGLVPRDVAAPGAGAGLVGLGRSQTSEVLREHKRRLDDALTLPPKTSYEITVPRTLGPAAMAALPEGIVDVDLVELDPAVREHLSSAVVERANAVRACYESWGLARDARSAGRLILALTLRPDGGVVDPAVEVTDPRLALVGECVIRIVKDWYLGDGLVPEPVRLAFPFVLTPRQATAPIDAPGARDR